MGVLESPGFFVSKRVGTLPFVVVRQQISDKRSYVLQDDSQTVK